MKNNIKKFLLATVAKSDSKKRMLRRMILRAIGLLPISAHRVLELSGSDKHRSGRHQYGYVYNDLFKNLKYRRLKLLEIGIGGYNSPNGGSSLLAWEAYFPRAKIVGCDLYPKEGLETRRTKIYKIDQSSSSDLSALVRQEGMFDIIIDDGSHLNRHQIFTFEAIFESLKSGGVYVVEDVCTSYWRNQLWDGEHVESDQFRKTCVGYFLHLAKYINHVEIPTFVNKDEKAVAYATNIKSISFYHNIIVGRLQKPLGKSAID